MYSFKNLTIIYIETFRLTLPSRHLRQSWQQALQPQSLSPSRGADTGNLSPWTTTKPSRSFWRRTQNYRVKKPFKFLHVIYLNLGKYICLSIWSLSSVSFHKRIIWVLTLIQTRRGLRVTFSQVYTNFLCLLWLYWIMHGQYFALLNLILKLQFCGEASLEFPFFNFPAPDHHLTFPKPLPSLD